MEFKRIEQENEVVLTYCPTDHAQPVVLRYERDLPQRLCEETKKEPKEEQKDLQRIFALDDAAVQAAETKKPKQRKRGNWVAVLVMVLGLTLSIGCVASGIWWIVDDFRFGFTVSGTVEPGNGGGNSGNTQKPNLPAEDRQEDAERPAGETTIETYRPKAGTFDTFSLVSVPEGTQPLTAGEVYRKLYSSTVTILGISEESYSVGTGIIFTSDGYIMTNYHVIAGSNSCEVWITDIYGVDSTYDARLVGGDEDQDLAILKVEAQGLTPAEFGVSSDLKVGDKVYAIGNPLGLELRSTFTDGIVSYVDRSVEVDGVTMTLLQTNAALNSGNSGGPLVNQYGQVVGINTIKMMSGYDTIEGLGFAIPTSIAARWVNDILTIGEIRPQPVLGLMINRIPVRLEDGTIGLEVVEVTEGGSADLAGVMVGDFVVGFNGVEISTIDEIYAERQKLSVGDEVSIRVYRKGRYFDLTMVMLAAARE